MKFWEAIKELQDGKKVRCSHWPKDRYIYFEHGLVWSECKCYYEFNIDYVLLRDIWELYKEPEKQYNFIESVQMMNQGKIMKRKDWDLAYKMDSYTTIVEVESNRAFVAVVEDMLATDWIEACVIYRGS